MELAAGLVIGVVVLAIAGLAAFGIRQTQIHNRMAGGAVLDLHWSWIAVWACTVLGLVILGVVLWNRIVHHG